MLMSRKDSMYQFDVFGIVVLQDRNKQSSVNVRLNMELPTRPNPLPARQRRRMIIPLLTIVLPETGRR